MKARVTAALLVALASPARASEDQAEMDRLRRVKTCIETLRGASERLDVLVKTWFSDPASAVNLAANFAILRERHDKYADLLKAYAKEADQTPADLAGLVKLIKELDEPREDLLAARAAVNDGDERFIWSLLAVDDGLNEVGGEFEAAKPSCGTDAGDVITNAAAYIGNLRTQVNLMRAYLADAAPKRSALQESILTARKLKAHEAYAKKAREALQSVTKQVDAALAADALAAKIQAWWHGAGVVAGIGRGAVTLYLQYTEALRILRSDLETGRSLQRELAALKGGDDSARAHISADLNLYVRQLEQTLEKLEQGGWQAVFERQKYLTGRRRAIAAQYPTACLKLLDAFDAAAAGVRDADSFRPVEDLYHAQVNACVKGGGQ